MNSKSANKYAGVIKFSNYENGNEYRYAIQFNTLNQTGNYYQLKGVLGLVDAGEDYLRQNGFNIVAGTYPTKTDEIAISKYLFETFKASDKNILDYDDLINKELDTTFLTNKGGFNNKLKIKAIIDFGQISNKFDELKNENPSLSKKDLDELKERYKNYIKSSFHALGYVSKDFYEYYKENYNLGPSSNKYLSYLNVRGLVVSTTEIWNVDSDNSTQYISAKIVDKLGLTYLDLEGKPISYVAPKEDEAYISYYDYQTYLNKIDRIKYQNVLNMIDSNLIPETSSLTDEEKSDIRKMFYKNTLTKEDKEYLD